MADTSVFKRLKRLFSTQAVIRNIGGKKLKVSDTSKIQAHGTRNLIDRYHRVHSAGQYGYSAQSNYDMYSSFQQARLQLFRDYDLMDADPIVASVLDIYADESTVKNEYGEILTITSENDQIQDILYNLFYDILNIEFNLWPWTRNMCKYGDFYLYLMISPEYGVSNVIPLSVYETTRIEGDLEEQNPFTVKFHLDSDHSMIDKKDFENYEIAHFRLLSDSNFLPYGKSMIENGRRIHKQVRLMEDAMLIHRITRAPDKRVFKVDVGNIPPGEIDSFMERIINSVKRSPLVDSKTGEYNMKFNMQNILEDFYFPVRGKDAGTEVTNLSGLQFNAIEDVEYLLHKLMAAFKVPKSFIGYEEDTSGKATLAAQDVRFARTIERIQRILISELNKIAIVHLYTLGYRDEQLVDFQISLTNPSMVYEMEKINLWKEKAALADQLAQGKYMSREWVYKNIFQISEEDIIIEQSNVIDDAKFEGQIQKVTQDTINPPPPPGQEGGMEGAPAGPPVAENDEDPGDEDLYDAEKSLDDIERIAKKAKMGRPPEGHKYSSDRDKLGRDPLGYKEILGAMDVLPKNKTNGKGHVSPRLREALKDLDLNLDNTDSGLLKD
jgi:hypothetical protein